MDAVSKEYGFNQDEIIKPPDVLTNFIERVPKHVLLVLDEVYIDFIDGDYIDTVDFGICLEPRNLGEQSVIVFPYNQI